MVLFIDALNLDALKPSRYTVSDNYYANFVLVTKT